MKPATPKFPKLLHGGDYNPDQWLDYPEILQQDIELMKQAGVNCVSLAIFAWSTLEPEEGVYRFEWLDSVINNLYENGIYTILATPSGARPVWMSHQYPEVLRVSPDRVRNLQGIRHNHCYTSPVYREKTKQMNTLLAKRYSHHPAIILWHVSNEYNGECHCDLCQNAFRDWLKTRYSSLDELNQLWWTSFWSHRYTSWDQVESPSPRGEIYMHALNLDWKRFVTHQTLDFFRAEIAPLKAENPEIPVTINMMWYYTGLNYFKFKDDIDVACWDSYPNWHLTGDQETLALTEAFFHDVIRGMKKQNFLLMESSPGYSNWMGTTHFKRPGMHMLASMAALGHGSNSVQYFQWRQSRGSCEKFHSAVVSQRGKNDTRIFKDVSSVGSALSKLEDLYNTTVKADVAIIWDTENKWAIDDMKGSRNIAMGYNDCVREQYKYFWKHGIAVDGIDMECDLDGYKLVIAPMLYMLRAGIADKLKRFVEQGGTLVTTYLTGLVDEHDLCHLGDLPGNGLNELLGYWYEDIEGMLDGEIGQVKTPDGKQYKTSMMAELIHPTTAQTLAVYDKEFYQGESAVTCNSYGKGTAYHVATQTDYDFNNDFYGKIASSLDILPAINCELPKGCSIAKREGEGKTFYFLQNFEAQPVTIQTGLSLRDVLSGEIYTGKVELEGFHVCIVVPNS